VCRAANITRATFSALIVLAAPPRPVHDNFSLLAVYDKVPANGSVHLLAFWRARNEGANAGMRAASPQGRVPFPSRPRSELLGGELGAPPAASAAIAVEDRPAQSFAPTLRNPDESPVTFEDEISLSPRYPVAPSTQAGTDPTGFTRPLGGNVPGMADKNREPLADRRSPPPHMPPAGTQQTRPLHNANFDAMWPAEAKPPKSPTAEEFKPEPKINPSSRDAAANAPKRADLEGQKSHAVAILKSGVVDGMGYTLYVDGSIEAELPQGTLHFASINELRNHLGKGS
jgi:hypothetical protein